MYRVERVDSEAELLALKEPWTALLTATSGVSIFLTWEWVSTWWRHYGQDKTLWVLTAWDDAGRLVGLVPWMLVYGHLGALRVRRIAFVGSTFTYRVHLDVIAGPDEKGAVCAAFLGYLDHHRNEWDVLDMEGLAEDSVLKPCLATASGLYRERRGLVSLSTSLPGDWDSFQKGVLSAKKRKKLRYFVRQLERDYPSEIVYHCVSEPSELSQAMDSLKELTRKRWLAQGRVTHFDSSRYVAFHRDLVGLALERNWLRFYQLKIAHQVIAVLNCFRYRDVLYAYQTTFDLDWGRYSPGQLMMAHVIQEGIKDGAREFDMLRGKTDFKLSWANTTRVESHLLFSMNWPGHLWLLSTVPSDAARSWGKRVLSQGLLKRYNRFISARRL